MECFEQSIELKPYLNVAFWHIKDIGDLLHIFWSFSKYGNKWMTEIGEKQEKYKHDKQLGNRMYFVLSWNALHQKYA